MADISYTCNVMKGAELAGLYNRTRISPRALMKVDIRKAYDSELGVFTGVVNSIEIPSTNGAMDSHLCVVSFILISFEWGADRHVRTAERFKTRRLNITTPLCAHNGVSQPNVELYG